MSDPRIDIADIASITTPFDIAAVAPAQPTEAIVAESEFDIAAVAAVDEFLDAFGETVWFMPSGGSEREIKAICVERGLAKGLDGMPRGIAPFSRWQVANDATKGITSYEIDDGKDSLKISQRLGKTAQSRKIYRLLKHDFAWCLFEVR